MSLLDGVIGGAMAGVVNRLIEENGGIRGIASSFQQRGLGDTVKSWVSTGPNEPVSGAQVHEALGPDTIARLAAKLGIPADELAQKLAEVLPDAVDRMTPNGEMPR